MRGRPFRVGAAVAAVILCGMPAGAQNLIPNGSFPSLFMLDGWEPYSDATWSAIDIDELANSGSVRVPRTSSSGDGPVSGCLPIEENTRYRVGGSALWIDAESVSGRVQLRLSFFQGGACDGFSSGNGGTGALAIEADSWHRIQALVDSSAGERSAKLDLWGWRTPESGIFVAYFDDLELVPVPEPNANVAALRALAGLAVTRRMSA